MSRCTKGTPGGTTQRSRPSGRSALGTGGVATLGRTAPRILLLTCLLLLVLLSLAGPATAYKGWTHSSATSKSSCVGGCHAESAPTNTTCTTCHTAFKVRGTQKCWDCHKPGQATASWQLLVGCTATCHVSTVASGQPSYSSAYTHSATVHLGASGYGKTCLSCHGVSAGGTAPGSSPHHDAVNSATPTCAGCHDGAIAAAPTGHEARGAACASCHTGMDRPAADCASCHVGQSGGSAPQIAYTNSLACADAGCHGKVANHSGTPIGAAACTTCHPAHYQALGACATCHPSPQALHHGTGSARPLADCAGCHDGALAPARDSHAGLACALCHAGMSKPAVPAVCSRCHPAGAVGTATCTACHSAGGLTGREQVHSTAPRAGLTCTTCHAGHHADLGACTTCHGLVPEAHHGVARLDSSLLALSATPARVSAGAPVVVSGTLTDASGAGEVGVQVRLQARRLSDGAFTDLAILTTDAGGSFSQSLRPVAGTEYRAVFRGSSATSAMAQRPAIEEATVNVARNVTVKGRPSVARVGAKVELTGVVTPATQKSGAERPAVAVRVERRSGARWVKAVVLLVKPKPTGAFSVTWRPRTAGSFRVRAAVAPSPDLLAGASPRIAITVR
jgi:hypothetical protein